MLYLESFIHRVTLAEVVARWIINQPQPGDVQKLKKIVNFNTYISRIWSDQLIRDLSDSIHGFELNSMPMNIKADLKDMVTTHPLYLSDRIEAMIAWYRRFPEDFYRETPVDGHIYFGGLEDNPRFVGASRTKRFRRIAEKGSRRIVDYLFSRIEANADDLAQERADSLGIPLDQLDTNPDLVIEEYAHAERRLIKTIKNGTLRSEFPILSIPDVVGLKMIVEDNSYDRLIEGVKANPDLRLLEEESHQGVYNAVNLRLAYMIPKGLLLSRPPSGESLDVLEYRGFDRTQVAAQYEEFINSAEDHVLVEVIISNFQDFLESEIGCSIHEERIFHQRSPKAYNSHLATSVRYLMNYILSMCRSPGPDEVTDVPIKLWVKYLPDTMEQLLQTLYVKDDAPFESYDSRRLSIVGPMF